MATTAESFIEVTPKPHLRAIVSGREMDYEPATSPLLTYDQIADGLNESDGQRLHEWHVKMHSAFLLRRNLPSAWRGLSSLYHYEVVLVGFKRVVPPTPKRKASVRRQSWLRELPRDAQHEAMAWFKALPQKDREELVAFDRHEEAERRADDRRVEKANRQYLIELELACGRERN